MRRGIRAYGPRSRDLPKMEVSIGRKGFRERKASKKLQIIKGRGSSG